MQRALFGLLLNKVVEIDMFWKLGVSCSRVKEARLVGNFSVCMRNRFNEMEVFVLFVWFRFWDAIVLWESFCSAIFDLSWLSFSELETNLWKFIECIYEIRSWWKSFDFDEGQTLFHHSSKHLKKPSSLFPTQKMPCDSLPQLLHGIKNKNLPQSLKLHFTIMMNFNSFLFWKSLCTKTRHIAIECNRIILYDYYCFIKKFANQIYMQF